jgi:hypothetical protein
MGLQMISDGLGSVMIQCLKNDKKSMNKFHFEGETSFYNISNSKDNMR